LISITLNQICDINRLKIGGWIGNPNVWNSANGIGAKIYTSLDKVQWTEVGLIPNGFGSSIITIEVRPTKAKYVQFQHSSYLGLGYFKAEGTVSSISTSSSVQSGHPTFINYWFSGPYTYSGKVAGTNELAGVGNRNLMNGIIL